MARKKRQTRYVIFASPEVRGPGPRNRFIARDGTETESSNRAAKFYTGQSALAFAKENGIALDGAMRYVGQMDFSEWDLREE